MHGFYRMISNNSRSHRTREDIAMAPHGLVVKIQEFSMTSILAISLFCPVFSRNGVNKIAILIAVFGMAMPFLKAQLLEKCSPALIRQLNATGRTDENKNLAVLLQVKDPKIFEKWMDSGGLTKRATYLPAGLILLESSHAVLRDRILPREDVLFADIGHLSGREEILIPGHDLFTDNIGPVHNRQPGLDGRGQVVSVKEFRFDSTDVDLKNRVL